MSNDWVVVMRRIEALSTEARDAKRESDRLQIEAALKDETIEALRKQVEHWKEVCQGLAWDNEDCDAELMKENNNEH